MAGLKEQARSQVERGPYRVYLSAGDLPIGPTRYYAADLDSLLLESVDEALTDVLGRRAREAIYDYLERTRHLAREEIPARLGDFLTLLEEAFGKGGETLGRVAAKRLYGKLGWEFVEVPQYTLIDYVEMLKGRIGREVKNRIKPMKHGPA